MVYGLIVAIVILAAGLYMASMNRPDTEQQDMSPNTLESFKATTNQEGAVVPLVFGKSRISANLMWYGNLETEEVVEQVESGGKGGGGGTQDVTVGYKYYMDIWEALCIGPGVSVLGTFINDKPGGVLGTLNPGDTTYYPTEPGIYAAPLNPVAHVFMNRQYLGENVSAVPTYHWVVNRDSDAPLTYANLSNGVNPAAVIYDILRMSGAESSAFVLSTFQDAADYWNTKGYGINITLSKQEETRNIIKRIFTYVDGNLRVDNQNRFELVAWKDTDTHSYTIDQNDIKEFNFRRRSWYDVYTDFRANFIDSSRSYTQRTIRVRNTAVRGITGQDRQLTVDLTAFIDVSTASKRLWEIMKQMSYPEAEVSMKVSWKYIDVRVGDIVRVSYDDYGISDLDFRIIGVDVSKADSNEITWTCKQLLSTLFDANFELGGEPQWVAPNYSPQVPYAAKVFELPYNEITGRSPAYLLLCARKGAETGFKCMFSTTGTDYVSKGTFGTFTQHGTLDETYPATTYTIDDETGILYTPDREDPSFDDIDRADLFTTMRFAIVDDEIMAFQNVDYEGGAGAIRLTGVIRGILNTTIAQHNSGAQIWITTLRNNILKNVTSTSFYIKMLPYFGTEVLDAASVSPIAVTYAEKAVTPWTPWDGVATRSGSNVSVVLNNTTQEILGAGTRAAESQVLETVHQIEGLVQYGINVQTAQYESATAEFSYTQAGAHTLYIRQYLEGRTSEWVSIYVAAADDDYYIVANQLTNTGLEKVQWGAQGFIEVINRNLSRLNDELLLVSGLIDVDLSGLADTNALTWNASTQKFEPLDFEIAFPTTTTTTSTTTTSTSSSSTTTTSSSTTTTTNTNSTTTTTTNTQSTTSTTSSTTTTTAPSVYEGEDVAVDAYYIEGGLL